MSEPAYDSDDYRTLGDLEVSLRCAIARIETASKALEVTAPAMARRQLTDSIQAAQGFLMQAEDLAIQHVRRLEVLTAEEKG